MEIKKSAKSAKKIVCEKCDYSCYKKSDWDRHVSTGKHNLSHNGNDGNKKKRKNAHNCECGKIYQTYSGFWKHRKICVKSDQNIFNENKNSDNDLTIMLVKNNDELKQMLLEQYQENKELKNMMHEQNVKVLELCKDINHTTMTTTNINSNINSNNKSFNLNFFLNETCKDAMNITDFVNSVKIQLNDLEKVGEIGYVDGISNIIIKNLKQLDITQRPLHCTDKKRETLYIKDDNKWEKENEENFKLRKAIKQVAHKNTKLLKNFKDTHPDCGKSDSIYSDTYNKLIIEVMGGQGDNESCKENKIIQKIAKEVIITPL